MYQDMGWSLPSWLPGLVQGSCPVATRPKEAVGRDNSQRPGPSLGPSDFHLLAPKCHPSSAPLPATPHRAAAPSTAPAAGAWRYSPVGLARGPWGAGSRHAQGTDSCSGGARPCLPAPRPTLSPATRAPRPRPAQRLPGSLQAASPLLQGGDPADPPAARTACPKGPLLVRLQPGPLTLGPRELTPTSSLDFFAAFSFQRP